MEIMHPQEKFMYRAIEEALYSQELGDYAVGACIVQNDTILAASGNRTHLDTDPTHHAEMIVIRKAAKILKRKNLHDCTLYSTHEPCPMCASAAIWAKINQVISGASIDDIRTFAKTYGNDYWKWRTIDIAAKTIFQNGKPHVIYIAEFMREECKKLFHA